MTPSAWRHRLIRSQFEVHGQSMEPAYPAGSRVWASRRFPFFRAPSRGDVVVIRSPAMPGRMELKRIIGLPCEELSWSRGQFRVNGMPLDEPYAQPRPAPPGDDEIALVRLSPRDYFVVGDNRLYSHDSRHYGPVARSAILGRILS